MEVKNGGHAVERDLSPRLWTTAVAKALIVLVERLLRGNASVLFFHFKRARAVSKEGARWKTIAWNNRDGLAVEGGRKKDFRGRDLGQHFPRLDDPFWRQSACRPRENGGGKRGALVLDGRKDALRAGVHSVDVSEVDKGGQIRQAVPDRADAVRCRALVGAPSFRLFRSLTPFSMQSDALEQFFNSEDAKCILIPESMKIVAAMPRLPKLKCLAVSKTVRGIVPLDLTRRFVETSPLAQRADFSHTREWCSRRRTSDRRPSLRRLAGCRPSSTSSWFLRTCCCRS